MEICFIWQCGTTAMTKRELPSISIVTPSFNQGSFVEATIRSVFDQRYPKLEYLFMDAASTDETLERVAPYRDRFAHFQSAPDRGQAAAISQGFARCRGEIMAYLNSDDLLLPGTLNFVADYFRRHPEIDLIYGHRCFIDAQNRVTGFWILPPHCNFLMRRWDLIPQESCFWRRSLFERAGNIDPGYWFAMDYDLLARYMRDGKFKRVNRFLAAFRVHEQAKTSTHLASTGAREVEDIRARYKIGIAPQRLGDLFFLFVQLRSAWFIRRHQSYPGLPPGIDYLIDEVWGK